MPPAPTSRPISERSGLGLPPSRCRSLQVQTCATPRRALRCQDVHWTGKSQSLDSGLSLPWQKSPPACWSEPPSCAPRSRRSEAPSAPLTDARYGTAAARQIRRFVFQELVGSPIFGVYDLYSRTTVNGTSAIPRVSRNHSRNRRPHEPVVGRLGDEFRFLSLALHREGSAPYLLQPSSRYWPRADGSRREDPCSSSPRS